MDIQTLEREALGLPAADRAKLAHELLESLDTLTPAEIESLWLDEATRRLAGYDAGLMTAIGADEVFEKAKSLLK